MNPRFRSALLQREADLSAKSDEIRAALRARDPRLLASFCGAEYVEAGSGAGELILPFWGIPRAVSFPQWIVSDGEGGALPSFLQALLLYYLFTADGAPLTGEWVSFAEIPNGRVYNAAFQGYTGDELAAAFALDVDSFSRACESAGGVRSAGGDAAYLFRPLPRVPLLANYWLGDEDFPSSCKILFDSSVSHYLPAEACAILGNMLKQKILNRRRNS